MSVKLRATTRDTGARIAEEGSKFKKHTKFTITAPERADDLAAAVTGPGNVRRRETKNKCIENTYLTKTAAGYSKRKSYYIKV